MPRKTVSLADRYRAARKSFELAMQSGCSPAQARETLRREDAERQWQESGERLRAAMNRPLRSRAAETAPAPVVEPALTTPEAPRRWWLD